MHDISLPQISGRSPRREQRMKRKSKIITMAFIFVLILSGCIGKDGRVYGQRRVLEYVDSVCTEPYDLEGRELIEENPDNMEYYFRTKNRDLTFTANSYLSPIWIDASQTSFYSREISCDYVETVHSLYEDELDEVFQGSRRYLEEHGWMYLVSFRDIEEIVDTVLEADEIYRQELEYNPPEFLMKNPLRSVHVVWHRSEEEAEAHETWVNVTDIGITGQHDREELYDRLADTYAGLIVDGKIDTDPDVPQRYLEDKHVSLLDTIELNGREMLYDDNDNPYGQYGLTTDHYKYSWYSEDLGSYMMVMDVGFITDGMSIPLINREYVKALGGSYEASVNRNIYTSTWTIGSDTWTMKAKYDDNEIFWVTAEKNSEPLDISYITVDDDRHVSATFCAGVTVDDFSRLFDLTYEIDEDAGTIAFEKEEYGPDTEKKYPDRSEERYIDKSSIF